MNQPVFELPVTYCLSDDSLPSPIVSEVSQVTWQAFHRRRNELLEILRPFGTVGPMGSAVITADKVGPPPGWPHESDDPMFFVISDQTDDMSHYNYVEVRYPKDITLPVLHGIVEFVRWNPDWSVGIGVPRLVYVFVDRNGVWISGQPLEACQSLRDIASACERYKPKEIADGKAKHKRQR